jgi:hypothetical protein
MFTISNRYTLLILWVFQLLAGFIGLILIARTLYKLIKHIVRQKFWG